MGICIGQIYESDAGNRFVIRGVTPNWVTVLRVARFSEGKWEDTPNETEYVWAGVQMRGMALVS